MKNRVSINKREKKTHTTSREIFYGYIYLKAFTLILIYNRA